MVSASAKSAPPDSASTNGPSSGGELLHERVNVPSWLRCVDEESAGGSITLIEQSRNLPHCGSWTRLIAEGGDWGSQSWSAGVAGFCGSQSTKCHHSGRSGGAEGWGCGSGSPSHRDQPQ